MPDQEQKLTDDKILNIKSYTERSFLVWGKEATMLHKTMLMDHGGQYGKFWKQQKLQDRGLTHEIPDDRKENKGENLKGYMFPATKRSALITNLIMMDINYTDWDAR